MDEMDEMDAIDLSEYDDDVDDFDAKRQRGGARVFTLFRKRRLDYSFLANNTSTTIVVRRALKLSPFYYYWVGLRLHNRAIAVGSTGNFALEFYPTLPTSEDPQEFSGAITAGLTLSMGVSDTPPSLKIATSQNLGPYMKILLRASQDVTASLRLYAELSAVLLARPA